jgi:hypothetical protein
VITYLGGRESQTPVRYWDFDPAAVTEAAFTSPECKRAAPGNWPVKRNPITLDATARPKNMWDVAGERMVIMGKEQGGIDEIWAHPFMALRDYAVSFSVPGGKPVNLNELTPEISVAPESFTRVYNVNDHKLKEIITCHPTDGTAVIHYEYSGPRPAKITVSFKSNLRFMWPYSEKVTGAIRYGWDAGLNAMVAQNKAGDFVTVVGTNRPVTGYKTAAGEGLIMTGSIPFSLEPGGAADVVIAVSATGLTEAVSAYRRAMLNPNAVYEAAVANA